MSMNKLNGLIIRNDHDELLILLERFKEKNKIVVNYDRHCDDCKNPKVDIGSWAYYGKKFGVIEKYIWVPANEDIFDWIKIQISQYQLSRIVRPIVLSICYDYLIGLKMDTGLVKKKLDGIFNDIKKHEFLIQFVYASRSIEYCQLKYIVKIDELLTERFKEIGINLSPLSQKPLLGRK